MILPDLNLLLFAVNQSAPAHEAAREWLEQLMNGDEPIGFAPVVLIGFIRLSTRSGIFPKPLPPAVAFNLIIGWVSRPNAHVLHPGASHWKIMEALVAHAGVAGNLTTDAHLAALAIEHEATIYTFDSDFKRFGGNLKVAFPLRSIHRNAPQ